MAKTKKNVLLVGGKEIPFEIKTLDIFDLNYYPENPRINYILRQSGKVIDQKIIDDELWNLDSTKKLAKDILDNGGLMEEIIVVGNQVYEGNSRLCAYRNIYRQSPEEQKNKWKLIRSKVILDETVNDKDLFTLLGNFHIKGKTQWDPFEKASYINRMINEQGIELADVVKIVGTTKTSLITQLKAYELMKNLYLPQLSEIALKHEYLKKFSIFEEYCKNSKLQKLVKEAPDVVTDDKFVNWVLEERVKSAAFDVRKLEQILNHKKARRIFLSSEPEDALGAAESIVHSDRLETANIFFRKISDTTDYIKNCNLSKVKEVAQRNPGDALLLLKKLRNAVKSITVELNASLSQNSAKIKKLKHK